MEPGSRGSRGAGAGKTLTGLFHREQRHLSQGTHASAVRGPTPLGWLASQSRERQSRETEKAESVRLRVKRKFKRKVD